MVDMQKINCKRKKGRRDLLTSDKVGIMVESKNKTRFAKCKTKMMDFVNGS